MNETRIQVAIDHSPQLQPKKNLYSVNKFMFFRTCRTAGDIIIFNKTGTKYTQLQFVDHTKSFPMLRSLHNTQCSGKRWGNRINSHASQKWILSELFLYIYLLKVREMWSPNSLQIQTMQLCSMTIHTMVI